MVHTDLDTRETLEKIIRTHPFWKGLDPVYFHILETCETGLTWGLGQPVFQADSDAKNFYLIHQGSVSRETFFTLQTIGAGQALGWSWFFPPYRWHFSARSHAVTEAVAFEAKALRGYGEENHNFGYELTRRLG